MEPVTGSVLVVLAAYLVGSIPFGLIVARLVRGQDIRALGSGNIGATNVGRVLGAKWGALILLADSFKGLLAVWLVPRLASTDSAALAAHLPAVCGLAAAVGHMFPCWLRFRGGKGVATSLGAAVILAPYVTLAAVVVFMLTFAATRIVALGSILGVTCFAVVETVSFATGTAVSWSLLAFSLVVPTLIVLRHKSNIGRMLRGEEPRYRSAPAERK